MSDLASEPSTQGSSKRTPLLLLAWLWVVLPFSYGVYELVRKVAQLFG